MLIPEKVYEELSVYERQKEVIEACEWIKVLKVKDQDAVLELAQSLDIGEAEAIILAKELNANLFVVDERKGRAYAESYGLNIISLLGVLLRSKQKGLIYEIKPILDQLIENVGFRVSKTLYLKILEKAKEI